MAHDNDPIVGIDLGTTNSVVAVVIDGKPQVLEENGEKLLPSIVGINPAGQLVTGFAARNQLAAFPDQTIASIKRRMGKMDPVSLGDQQFTPPEISAIILRRLRERASKVLGVPVRRAVITVPAFFDENQRQATREAGTLAGFNVERIINEPTAATLVYHVGSHDRKHIVVYDFGGGTFDVSVVRMEAGVIEVLSSHGDTQLGGDDLDLALLNVVAERFLAEHGVDLRNNPQSRYRTLLACEKAKCQLSTFETVQIVEEFIAETDGRPLHLTATITRAEFEELIEPFVARTITSVDEALRDANLTLQEIDDLVLVGGSTRIPLVEERLRSEFLREPSRAVDPDLAVALGAAVQGAMLEGQSVGRVLVDVTGHTLGIEVCEEMTYRGPLLVFSPMIHRNTPLPARYECAYRKVHPDQTAAEIHVLQGEYDEVERNQSIGRFTLPLAQGGGDLSKIVVRFDLTLDGTLKVAATQTATGKSEELTISNALSKFRAVERMKAEKRIDSLFGTSMDDAIRAEMAEVRGFTGDATDEDDEWEYDPNPTDAVDDDGEELEGDETGESEEADDSSTIRIDATHGSATTAGGSVPEPTQFAVARALLLKAESLQSSVNADDAKEIADTCKRLRAALVSRDAASVASLCEELDDILFYVQ